jgi:hypothetical protein
MFLSQFCLFIPCDGRSVAACGLEGLRVVGQKVRSSITPI